MGWVFLKHDIGILRQAGGTASVGMMLARDPKTKAPIYEEIDDEYLAEQQTQVPGYSGLPYEKELRLSQTDFRAGFGLEYFDSADPTRYHASFGMDLRHRGQAIPANDPKTQALTTALAITDSGMELWDDASTLTNWTYAETGAGPSLAREAATVNAGTFSAKLTVDGADTNEIYQEMANWDNAYRSVEITVRWYAFTATVSAARIEISDGVGTTNGTYHTGGGGWELLSCTRTLDPAASKVRITLTNDAGGAGNTVFWDGAAQVPAQGAVRVFAEFNGDLYLASGTYLFKIDNVTGDDSPVLLAEANITDLQAFTDDKLYIALGASDNYYHCSTADVCTQTDSKALFFAALGTTMWKALLPRSIYSATDPTADANWSAATTVDTPSLNITDLLAFDNSLYIPKEDRPFYLDSAAAVQTLTNITRPATLSTSGKNALEWQANLYFPIGNQGLLEWSSVDGTFIWRDPAGFITRQAEYDGRVQALAADEVYLYAVVDDGAKLQILAGRLEVIGSSTAWAWHPIHQITLTGCESAFVSAVFQRRLWIGSTTPGESLYYIPIPAGYGDVEADANRSVATDASPYFETVFIHGDFRDTKKSWIKLTLELGHVFNANIGFAASYKTTQQTSYTSINTGMVGTSSDRRPAVFIDVTNKPADIGMRFKIAASTNAATALPILTGIHVEAVLVPPRRKIIECEVRASQDTQDKQGKSAGSGPQAKDVIDALDELVSNTPEWPVTFYDILGNTRTVRVLPRSPYKKPMFNEKTLKLEWRYFLRLQVVDLS